MPYKEDVGGSSPSAPTAFPRQRTAASDVALGWTLASYVDFGPTDKNFAQSWVSQPTLAEHLGIGADAIGVLAREGHAAGWWTRCKRPNNSPWWTLSVPLGHPESRSAGIRKSCSTGTTSSSISSLTSSKHLADESVNRSETGCSGSVLSMKRPDDLVAVRLREGGSPFEMTREYAEARDHEIIGEAS